MVQLQQDLAEIKAMGTQVVGISYDAVEVLSSFADTAGVTFALLSDPDSTTIKAYGIHNEKGLPHPGTYLIGSDGVVRAELFIEGYRDRHSTTDLIVAVRRAASQE